MGKRLVLCGKNYGSWQSGGTIISWAQPLRTEDAVVRAVVTGPAWESETMRRRLSTGGSGLI